jgi:type II secretion system protein I
MWSKKAVPAMSHRGFTLIELLCALAVFAAVMVVALRTLSSSAKAVATIAQSQTMVAMAEAHLAELMVIDQPTVLERSGNGGTLAWRETIKPTDDTFFAGVHQIGLGAWTVEVEITAPNGRHFQLRSIRLVRGS